MAVEEVGFYIIFYHIIVVTEGGVELVMLFDREGVEHGERIAVVEGWQRQTQG